MFHLPGRGTTALTVKSSPPKTAQTATRLGVRAGVLTKRDERGAWQRRYCALVPQTLLFYYDDETSDDARGIIDLEYYGDVQIVRGRTLRLATASDVPLRSFFFQAETEEQAQKWCEPLVVSGTSSWLMSATRTESSRASSVLRERRTTNPVRRCARRLKKETRRLRCPKREQPTRWRC